MSAVNQTGASGINVVGGNQYNTTIASNPTRQSNVVDQLIEKLVREVEKNQQIKETVERLQYYSKRRVAEDGIIGLQAKLTEGGRANEVADALEMKDEFERFLDQWSLFASAQEIFAHLLARIQHEFNSVIFPQIGQIPHVSINILTTERIVDPVIDVCGVKAFTLNHRLVMGMLYWLAERCFVRWHK